MSATPAPVHNPITGFFETLTPSARELLGIGATWSPPDEVRTLVLAGPNSAGKSLVMRQIGHAARESGIKAATISMAMRTGGGLGTMVYGLGEGVSGTGANSAQATMGLLASVGKWTTPALLGFDEPDIGLADEYAIDMAHRLADAVLVPEPQHWGTVLTSHNRMLLTTFHDRLTAAGHPYAFLALQTPEVTSIPAWVARPVVRRSLEELRTEDVARFRAITALRRAPNESEPAD